MSEIEERVDALGQWEFDDKATMAASMLTGHGHAYVDLQPGDATTYKIVIVQPLIAAHPGRSATGWTIYPDTYWVGTSFGPLWQYSPKNLYSWDYVADKWVPGQRAHTEWTARVIARFLNTLREEMQ